MSTLLLSAIAACGLIGGGLYLVLTSVTRMSRRAGLGWALIACSFLPATDSLLILPGSIIEMFGFCLSMFAVVTTAVITITSRHLTRAVLGFSLLVILTSTVFAAGGAMLPAVANVIVSLGSISTVLFSITIPAPSETSQPRGQMVWLGCFAGAVLLMALITAIRSTVFTATLFPEPDVYADASIAAIGGTLLENHGVSLVLAGMLLFVAVVGLTLVMRTSVRVQKINSRSI